MPCKMIQVAPAPANSTCAAAESRRLASMRPAYASSEGFAAREQDVRQRNSQPGWMSYLFIK